MKCYTVSLLDHCSRRISVVAYFVSVLSEASYPCPLTSDYFDLKIGVCTIKNIALHSN